MWTQGQDALLLVWEKLLPLHRSFLSQDFLPLSTCHPTDQYGGFHRKHQPLRKQKVLPAMKMLMIHGLFLCSHIYKMQ